MDRRFVLFLVLSFAILMGYSSVVQRYFPRKPPVAPQAPADHQAKTPAEKASTPKPAEQKPAEKTADKRVEKKAAKSEKASPAMHAATEPESAEKYVTLGSVDPDSSKNPYRMLVTLSTKGAALARVELSSDRYRDIDNRSGYLGSLVLRDNGKTGGLVQVVGPGTPAAKAGLKPGDLLKAVGNHPISNDESVDNALKGTKPGRTIQLTIVRAGKEMPLTVSLRRRPLEVIHPENSDPASMLLTLQQFDKQRLVDLDNADREKWETEDKSRTKGSDDEELRLKENRYSSLLSRELEGVALRTKNWRLVESDDSHATFRRAIPQLALEITKTYRLAKAPSSSALDADYPAYHLEFSVEIHNVGHEAHDVAYRLDGPNGLPMEGVWYASKVSRNWGGAGLRDFIVSFDGGTPEMIGATAVGANKGLSVFRDMPPEKLLTFVGVDAQYFSAVLMPQRQKRSDVWFDEIYPIHVGKPGHVPFAPTDNSAQRLNLTNTSCRLVSVASDIKPGETLTHRYKLFAGPKKPALLESSQYNLGTLVYYGWPIFAAVAVPLTKILHALYFVTANYGLAIILLTVLVRGCMFPLSLKQAAGAQKMQLLQPEIKKLRDKHKNNMEAFSKAQRELFTKHNYNPLSGCLPIFIQMPVFIGLYRCLMVDIELRDAPLLSHAIRWCSNLAAPDLLFDWSQWMPPWFNSGQGMFALGPYFNLLPLLTVGLMLWQQKMFMPPPADEQAAMQQKMMNFMMLFMGLLFFKVASGLCIYFIASSLWGLGERRLLPKAAPAGGAMPGANGAQLAGNGQYGETRAQAKAREAATKRK
ncbi:MAG: YidC/Oxa1 family insertase periplasmic-domain containing protein [Planctomycetaceae bacterium]|nr:YidC/Oxa1 family insertase periplasmic-domain containing protein [Planctomycetaceae bacterium]